MKRTMLFTLLILAVLGSITPALAQEGYNLDGWTVDGGGASSPPGTSYSLGGTVGQPDAAIWRDNNGYALSGGFWGGNRSGGPDGHQIYLPLVLRNPSP